MIIIDTALLSRIQFAFTISFHILFPAFSIGLITFITIMEGLWLKTKNKLYFSIAHFWTKIFALTFGMGVVSGIVMEFQLGTNWAGFTRQIGGVLGPLFTYEVMTAFFIEAGFLGVMLFGWKRVSPQLHFLASVLVFVGTTLSAFWILCANTWMQHPVGVYKTLQGFSVESWRQVVFNPDTIPRFLHMMLASYICAGFVIVSVSALYLLKNRYENFAKKCFSFMWLALLIVVPLQILVGDATGLLIHKIQPLKTAAMEGVWDTQPGAPLLLFAIPDQKQQKNLFEIGIPHGAALINTHSWNGVLTGLKSVPPEDQPNVIPVFFSFRIMVGAGLLMLLMAIVALYLRIKQKLFNTRWFLLASIASAPLGFIALWCGWITAEMGRQPWIVYNLIRTVDAVSPVSVQHVMLSFALIFFVYGIIFGVFYFYFLHRTLHKGPADFEDAKPARLPFQYMPASRKSEGK